MERRECETRYELAAAILPSRLRRIAMELPETDKKRAEEFRLRAGHCLSVLLPEGERSLEAIVTTEVCNAAARHRAAQLGIAVIDLEELKTGQIVHRLKVIMKAE